MQSVLQLLPFIAAFIYSAAGIFVSPNLPHHPLFSAEVYNLCLFLGQIATITPFFLWKKDSAKNRKALQVSLCSLPVLALIFDYFFYKIPLLRVAEGDLLSWYMWWGISEFAALALCIPRVRTAAGAAWNFIKHGFINLYIRYGLKPILVLVGYVVLPLIFGGQHRPAGNGLETWIAAVHSTVNTLGRVEQASASISIVYWSIGYAVLIALFETIKACVAAIRKREVKKESKKVADRKADERSESTQETIKKNQKPAAQKPPVDPRPFVSKKWTGGVVGLIGAIAALGFLVTFFYEKANGHLGDPLNYVLWWLLLMSTINLFVAFLRSLAENRQTSDQRRQRIFWGLITITTFAVLNREKLEALVEKISGHWSEYIGLAFKVLMVTITAVLLGIVFLFVVFLCISAVTHIWDALVPPKEEKGKKAVAHTGEFLRNILHSETLYVALTCSVIAMYFVLPFILGNGASSAAQNPQASAASSSQTDDAENSQADAAQNTTIIVSWIEKVQNVTGIFDSDEAKNKPNNEKSKMQCVMNYTLIYISLLGIGAASSSVLYHTIKRFLGRDEYGVYNAVNDEDDFWGQYSTSIGILAVGIALLLAMSGGRPEKGTQMIGNVGMQLVSVIFIVSIIIIALEIIRLLIDNSITKGTIIRKGVRYLFLVLVDSALSIFLDMIRNVTIAIRSVLSSTSDVDEKLINDMMRGIKQSLKTEGENIEKEATEDEPEGPAVETFRRFSIKNVHKGGI